MARKEAKTVPGPMIMVVLEKGFSESIRIVNDKLAAPILLLGARAVIWLKLRLMSVDNMVKWTEKRMPVGYEELA